MNNIFAVTNKDGEITMTCVPYRECELERPRGGMRRCTYCGAFVKPDAVWDCCGTIPIRYCPNCGSRVKR